MSILRCKDADARLQIVLDQEGTFGQKLALHIHLLMCSHCRRYARQQRLLQRTLRDSAEFPFPEATDALKKLPPGK